MGVGAASHPLDATPMASTFQPALASPHQDWERNRLALARGLQILHVCRGGSTVVAWGTAVPPKFLKKIKYIYSLISCICIILFLGPAAAHFQTYSSPFPNILTYNKHFADLPNTKRRVTAIQLLPQPRPPPLQRRKPSSSSFGRCLTAGRLAEALLACFRFSTFPPAVCPSYTLRQYA